MIKVSSSEGLQLTYTHLLRSGSSTVSSNVIPNTAQSWANGINVSLPMDLAITDSVSVKLYRYHKFIKKNKSRSFSSGYYWKKNIYVAILEMKI